MSWQEVEKTISNFGRKDQLLVFGVMGVTGIFLMKSKASLPTAVLTMGGAYLAGNMLVSNLLESFIE